MFVFLCVFFFFFFFFDETQKVDPFGRTEKKREKT